MLFDALPGLRRPGLRTGERQWLYHPCFGMVPVHAQFTHGTGTLPCRGSGMGSGQLPLPHRVARHVVSFLSGSAKNDVCRKHTHSLCNSKAPVTKQRLQECQCLRKNSCRCSRHILQSKTRICAQPCLFSFALQAEFKHHRVCEKLVQARRCHRTSSRIRQWMPALFAYLCTISAHTHTHTSFRVCTKASSLQRAQGGFRCIFCFGLRACI